jgi:nitroreductase
VEDAMMANAWSVAPDGSPGPALRECLEAAIAAPSIHNTQPWRFRLYDGVIEVLADPRRRLATVDPRGREMHISIGAAVLNLRVALLAHGCQPLANLFPSAAEPDLVARVVLGPPRHLSETVRRLTNAIPRRHTNRRPFTDVPVPGAILSELADAAHAEGGTLAVADDAHRDALLSLVRTAEHRWFSRPDYLAELAEWTLASTGRTDGVPPEAFGPRSAAEAVPLRDFGLIQPARRRRVMRFEQSPAIAVLHTAGDSPAAWVRAGQALERVLLTATARGLASTPMTQPLEIPELRELLTDHTGGLVPQAVLRLGYGPESAPSPRRALDEVLVNGYAPAGRT